MANIEQEKNRLSELWIYNLFLLNKIGKVLLLHGEDNGWKNILQRRCNGNLDKGS